MSKNSKKHAKGQDGSATSGESEKFDAIDAAFELCASGELIKTATREAYITLETGETMPLSGEQFQLWLIGKFFEKHNKVLRDIDARYVAGNLRSRALMRSFAKVVCVRVAAKDSATYVLDLGGHVVVITKDGWSTKLQPQGVRLLRPDGSQTLPDPVRTDESVLALLGGLFPRLPSNALILCAAWLVGCLRPSGPYPLLQVLGPHGSGKSTLCSMLKALIDPCVASRQPLPSDERDLAIRAQNSFVLLFENVSDIRPSVSDALCRVATGGGFATRKLYSNSDQVLFDFQRPVILNGIGDVVERADLKDRTLQLHLPPISDDVRETEDQAWARFRQLRPAILGGLCDAAVEALYSMPLLTGLRLRRLADWHKWVIAALPVIGIDHAELEASLDESVADGVDAALAASPVAQVLLRSVEIGNVRLPYRGAAAELLASLTSELTAYEWVQRREWPNSPQALSNALRRLEASLAERDIRVTFDRSGGRRTIHLTRIPNGAPPVPQG